MIEVWKNIKDYENLYAISNYGKIRSCISNKVLKPVKMNTGYYRISLCKNKNKREFYIHRLVAQHFLNNNKNLTEVNHIDGNKSNNCVTNLEWCNRKYNIEHSIKILGNKFGKRRPVQCLETNRIFSSLTEASKYYNKSTSNLCSLLKGTSKSKTYAGYHWKYY